MFNKQGRGVLWERDGERMLVESVGRDGIRVRATKNREFTGMDWALADASGPAPSVNIADGRCVVTNGEVSAEVLEAGRCIFRNARGEVLLEEAIPVRPWGGEQREYRSRGGGTYQVAVRFRAMEGERIYGLGQHQHGLLDQKGAVVDLVQYNTEVSIPFLVSSRMYGLLWNNPALGRVELGHNATRWTSDATRQVDYVVVAADTFAGIMERYAALTGHPPVLPEWAAGFWQCKLRYATQEELLAVAREYRKRGLPLSVIVIDFFHWTRMGEWKFDPRCWPDPAGMVRELDSMGVKLMVSVWPTVSANSENFDEMTRRGFLAANERGVSVHHLMWDNDAPGRVYVQYYDATNPEARKYVWEKVKGGYRDIGVGMFWLDACEPEMLPPTPDNVRYLLGNGSEVGNIYPLLHARGFFEGMEAAGDREIVNLCRSAWAGSQRWGAAVWSGDIPSTFAALRAQVPAGLNIGLSGIPWWTTDIGGFEGGDVNSPAFRELLVRWFQYGTFCPIFRLHGNRRPAMPNGSGSPNEVWSYGEEVGAILEKYLRLRERLRPYIMRQMREASRKGTPVMRPLFFEFAGDAEAFVVEDQYMFGPDLLVAPVLHEGARKRSLYLPKGTGWTDAWTGEKLGGGRRMEADAPMESIPLYLREGAVLPIRD